MSCEVRIGTSGFQYKHWKGPFYPEDLPENRMLDDAFVSPLEITTDFTDVRLHGPSAQPYLGCYTDEALREWAKRIGRWAKRLKAVFVYFDNDQAAWALQNAMALKILLP